MKHKEVKDKLSAMDIIIEKEKLHYLELILEVAIKYYDKKIDRKTTIKEILDLFINSLTSTYLIVSDVLPEIYPKVKQFEITDILDYTYQEDGKTLEERIEDYFSLDIDKPHCIKKLSILLDNETKIIKQMVLRNKIGPVASLVVIECNENDCHFGCGEYAGEYATGDEPSLPPYHPNCLCTFYYIETDETDDIKDLDAEIEKSK